MMPLSARLILVAGLLAHFLFFVRVAIVYAPAYYLGPSGADRVFYFSYVRSVVIDRDLDFENEMRLRPPSSGLFYRDGKPVNKYPIGAPLLSLPAYVVTHAALRGIRGSDAPLDGYEPPYVYTYALSQYAFAVLGLFLIWRVLVRYFDPAVSAAAVVAAVFGTELLRYSAADLIMSHAAASFSTAWCLYESVHLRIKPLARIRWFRLGASAALVVMARLQNGIFLVVPAIAALAALRGNAGAVTARLRAGPVAGAAGGLVMALPQLLVWRATTGRWVANGYSAEMSFTWLDPQVGGVACLLAKWLPLLVIGVAGCMVVALRRRDAIFATLAACTLGTVYISASWWAWDIAPRATFDNLATVAVGLAVATERLRALRPGAEWLLLGATVLWNVPFTMLPHTGRDDASLAHLRGWWQGFKLLVGW